MADTMTEMGFFNSILLFLLDCIFLTLIFLFRNNKTIYIFISILFLILLVVQIQYLIIILGQILTITFISTIIFLVYKISIIDN